MPTRDEIFLAAREISDAQQRSTYLTQACGADASLRHEVEAMLEEAGQADFYFGAEDARDLGSHRLRESVGTIISRYKLLERIGEGGMGVVYMAQQREPVLRKVALKIIKAGMDTRQVVARFEAERQALALMDHPNIAKIHDGGATETGRPYFVMELVRGVPITKYCEANNLSMRERIDLFVQVCQAVQHAHQKGIIHRDLKPSNILVTVNDGVPVPKVIDFGVAKATQQELTEKTIFTQFHQFIGTPAYMSPEQAQMTSVDIDTRTDIYSLGVLLYELLTGKTPFDGKELLASGIDEMRRTIREKEPLKPSTRLSRERTGAKPKNQNLKSDIDSDLDWIVMKCLEKDRARRYETANGLAADIERHLGSQPVLARPPNAAYRLQKLVQRNRAASIAVAGVVLALLLGIGLSTWALARERNARLREQAALKQANERLSAALGFVDKVLTNVAPEMRLLAGATKAQDKLLQAGLSFMQTLRESAGDNPAARVALARLLLAMSNRQNPGEPNTTGDYEVGLKQAEEALRLLEETPQLTDAERGQLFYSGKLAIIHCLDGMGRWEEAVARAKDLFNELQRSPKGGPQGRTPRMALLLHQAWENFNLGRTNDALQCALSVLSSDWAREITNQLDRAGWEKIQYLMLAHDTAGDVYGLLLRDFGAMRPHVDESVRLGELAMRQFPTNVHLVYVTAQFHAWQGYALMHTGEVDAGAAALDKARQELEVRVDKEASSEAFRNQRRIIAAIQALAFSDWSQDRTVPIAERRQRLAKAEKYLAEAEEFSRTVKLQSRTMMTARVEVPAARAKLEEEERVPAKP